MKFGRMGVYALGLAIMLFATPLLAADLRVGTIRGNPSIDPHFSTTIVAYEANSLIFEPLVKNNNDGTMGPWLATSWKRIDDTTWEFKLRQDVKWQDGQPFTADDVAFSFNRARQISPAGFGSYLRAIKDVQVVDPYTVRLITNGPVARLLYLQKILIVSKHATENATTADFQSGKAMIGTGPYKFVSWTPNDTVIVERNPDYWGPKPSWDKVTYIGMPNDASRVAALRAGDIDVALSVPPTDIAALKKDPKISVYGGAPNRIVFVAIDDSDQALSTGMITGPNGEKLDKNPLADVRVRTALRLAINLDAIKNKVFDGLALPTGQLLHSDMFGYIPGMGPWKADPAKARQLLQESGWAGKFKMTIATSDTNFPLAVETSQALAQLWTQIGIPTQVTVLQESVFEDQRNQRKLPLYPTSWTNENATAEDAFPAILHSRDTKLGWGATNQTFYSNPQVDKLIEDGLTTFDDAKREAMFRQAGKIAFDDSQIIPLMSPFEEEATKKGIVYKFRHDAYTRIENIVPAGAAANN